MSNEIYDHWADLHHHSYFSVLDGYADPGEIIQRAVELGRRSVAITDHGSVSGHVLFEKALEGFIQKQIGADTLRLRTGEKIDIKPIFGMEAYMVNDVAEPSREKTHLTLLAANTTGYRNLLHLATKSFDHFYYRQNIDGGLLAEHRDGLIVLSGCELGRFMGLIGQEKYQDAYQLAYALRSVFGERFAIELQHFPHMYAKNQWAHKIATELGIKPVLTCDVHYLPEDGWRDQKIMFAIRDRCSMDQAFTIEHAHPWEPDRLLRFLKEHHPSLPWETVMWNTGVLAESIENFRLPRAPHVIFPMEGDKLQYIYDTCLAFLRAKGLDENYDYRERLARELKVIEEKGYQDYFLMVADMVRWAKENGIFVGPARGSAAGSIVCWGLRITELDPIRWNLLFERFVDPTRVDLPDIDVDFEDERRAEVVQYMKEKYGEENVANIATFAKFGDRNTLLDVARVFNIPQDAVRTVERYLVHRSSGDQRAELTIADALQEPAVQDVFQQHPELEYATRLQGKIRHIGKHAAGIVVTSQPVTDFMAVYANKQSGERILAVDWRDSAYLNLMKIDVLGLKELTIMRMIAERVGLTLDDLYELPLDDQDTIDLYNRRDYLGLFQFDGLAVKSVAERVHFDNLQQIADVNALARPGPLHAGATEAYIRGRQDGQYDPVITFDRVQPIIAPTYGQIVYQETVMRILREIGGLSWQDVCEIRVIMGKSKGSEAFNNYWERWRDGCAENSVDEATARQIWETIRLYGKHAFNISHAVAYGLVSYWSAYMKTHYPREFYWARLVKSEGAVDDGRYIWEALQREIEFAPISLAMPSVTWDIDAQGRITPGWQQIPGFGPTKAAKALANGPYESIDDFARKNAKSKPAREKLAALLAEWDGKTVVDIYGLDIWGKLAQAVPERISIAEVRPGDPCIIAGRVIKLNRKNRIEEWRTKGKDTSRLNPDRPQDYVVLTLEDETGSVMVYVSPELYERNKRLIWENQTGFLVIVGNRNGDIPLVMASGLRSIEEEGIREGYIDIGDGGADSNADDYLVRVQG